MTPPDTREQARAAAERFARGYDTSFDEHMTTALAALLDARDAAHAGELQQAKNMHLERALERDAARAEVATLTEDLALAREHCAQCVNNVATLRSRLSTVERERDEGRGLLKRCERAVTRNGTMALADDIRAYLSRSPVEGGRGMVTATVPETVPTGNGEQGEL